MQKFIVYPPFLTKLTAVPIENTPGTYVQVHQSLKLDKKYDRQSTTYNASISSAL